MSTVFRSINWLDILFVILLLGMIYKGVRTGVGGQLLSLAGWFFLLFASLSYYNILSTALFGSLLQKWARPASFFAIAFFVFICIKIAEKLSHIIIGEELAPIEKIGGALVAVLRSVLLFGLIGIFLLLVPMEFTRVSVMKRSRTGMFFVNLDAKIYSLMTGHFGLSKKQTEREVVRGILSQPREAQE